jgi:ATP-dependent helicase/nuclease subunit B
MSGGAQRVFLGWDGPALERAAEWIHGHLGEDLRDVLVALPGSRAARGLREKLALRARPAWYPPRFLTQGELVDELVLLDRPVAGRLARTLAWSRALADLPRERLELLTARPPESGDLRGSLALAEVVRTLHAELAQEGLGFVRLARGDARPSSAGEARRFEVLAEAQGRWRKELDALGLADPHESRFAAIEAGKIDPARRVVLVGVADINHLLRRLAERLGPRVKALVFAPESEAAAFDELGCLRTEAWKDRDLALPLDRWHVVDGPDAQAERAVSVFAALDGKFAPEEVAIGVCDEEVAPHLERRFAAEGVLAQHAAGTPVEHTRPCRLLAELAAWLPRRAYAPYAALVRHPDLEAAVRERLGGGVDLAAELDAYHERHLPGTIDGRWLAAEDAPIRRAHGALLGLIGDLASSDPRPLAAWPEALRSFLAAVYSAPLDPKQEGDRVLAESFAILSDALEEIESLPGDLGATLAPAAEAIDLALSIVRGASVPPRAPAPGEAAVELLGWLELPLDDAPALLVTGFQEGFVPRSRRDDAFLPDGLRKKLGLPCADDRVARDLYAAGALVASRKEIAFVSGRRSRTGDPLLPSRFLFHAPKAELLERVDRSRRTPPRPRRPPSSGSGRYALPRLERAPELRSMDVTAFGDYLRSPYGFYLKHVLGVETLDDSAREMDPRGVGSLAHSVLERLGRSDLRDSSDEKELERWLRDEVRELGRRRFGARPLPAVGIQLAQLAHRLAFFARAHARRAAEGWRVLQVEWKPEKEAQLHLAGGAAPMPLHGKIDRIDVLDRGDGEREWAILDYKTSASAKSPERAHRSRGEWRDLQLPLYTLLAVELGFEEPPSLGYFSIGKDETETGVALAKWTPDDLEEAYEAAREVVRSVRAGRFFELGRDFPEEPILRALAGRGLVEPPEEEVGASEAGSG